MSKLQIVEGLKVTGIYGVIVSASAYSGAGIPLPRRGKPAEAAVVAVWPLENFVEM